MLASLAFLIPAAIAFAPADGRAVLSRAST
jgi:hypothetical protein